MRYLGGIINKTTLRIQVKVQTRKALTIIINQEKDREKTVVTTNGCFDLMHVGHLRYLQAAKNLGDLLVVGVNSDNSVRELKGERRPLIPEDERAEMLAGLDCVDYVVIFPELDPISLLSELKPDIHVKGGDYTIEQVIERQVVEENGGRVIVGLNIEGKSTTNVIQTILHRF
ncbi:TPA: D-glycero-beta-D-manno-heptose 1-phosphate adenylyltransferase [Candidatus Poribacteria bacterium]|nr:D-glycero-beta-D-manno-heptose 1-phosphate adenylyltransferase [Candidatus Poribacteria bacterium]HIA66409.1 D-glycero-beta-D-manno-heptose 1-phosphate adenylyltransferase [Candidatus Poribacteria bacterium]HIB86178.1 D-glycero-beta-D-manno-heptose 1-phosphate adenylyltransferase [Candidatus Poribacteria bacterium]HIC00953.1 D-glycero-beta-D-manno-heptose 1-phosphate adenylyltransferase [Candidatus Poribacteria bacterium]HIC18317.1 D-glycero-beta-D-manno-heptose 1-phosphate adenylyltransfera